MTRRVLVCPHPRPIRNHEILISKMPLPRQVQRRFCFNRMRDNDTMSIFGVRL